MIVSGRISKVITKDGKKVFIEIKVERVLALLFDGPGLIDEFNIFYLDGNYKHGPDYEHLNRFGDLFSDLGKFNLTGYIRKHDVIISLIF